jgi:hypothetical protein
MKEDSGSGSQETKIAARAEVAVATVEVGKKYI